MGDRGVSERMQAIYHAASVAFHLEDILNMDKPKEKHNEALRKLYVLVKEKLMRVNVLMTVMVRDKMLGKT